MRRPLRWWRGRQDAVIGSSRELLGEVTVPSGVLVVTDMGYLGSWSGDRPPSHVPGWITDPKLRASVAAARDLRIDGPDAQAAARTLGLQSFTWLYDIPAHGLGEIHRRFQDVVDEHRLAAELVEEPVRVPHRIRAQRVADRGGGDFIIDGVWTVAVPVAAQGALPVTATMRAYGGVVGQRWETVEIRIREAPSAATREVGVVGVDSAQLILADVQALGAWVHEGSLDGLADVAFWGGDADEAAAALAAGRLPEGVHGWTGLPLEDAARRALEVERWAATQGRRLRCEVRPHSHHYQVMAQIRAAEFGHGQLDLGGARVLGFSTTWGDGVFPVEVDVDAAGRMVGVRVRLGDEARRSRTKRVLGRA